MKRSKCNDRPLSRSEKIYQNRLRRLYSGEITSVEPWMNGTEMEFVMNRQWEDNKNMIKNQTPEERDALILKMCSMKRAQMKDYDRFGVEKEDDPSTWIRGQEFYDPETGMYMHKALKIKSSEWLALMNYVFHTKLDELMINMNGWERLYWQEQKEVFDKAFIMTVMKELNQKAFEKFDWNTELFTYKGKELTAYQIAQVAFKVTDKRARAYQMLKVYLFRESPAVKKAKERLNAKEHGDYYLYHYKLSILEQTVGRNAEWAVRMVRSDLKTGKKPRLRVTY